LFEQIACATVVALCINNSCKLAQFEHFPIPIGIKVSLEVKATIKLSEQEPNALLQMLDQIISQGIQKI
tara:strand:- start:8227 stop:8433 length:207 start_codon:yes stop_codon:yes gene_type:complete